MALIKRNELPALLKSLVSKGEEDAGSAARVFLLFGERYLCRKAADSVQNVMLEQSGGGSVNSIDGDTEDASKTLGKIMNYSLLPGTQIFRVTDSRLFHSKAVASAIWAKIVQARDAKKENACCRHLLSLLTLAGLEVDDPLHEISASQWQKLFSFAKPVDDLLWASELLASSPLAKKQTASADISGQYVSALKKGLPPANVLILCAEDVDKRKQLYKCIKEEGVVVDCSVVLGAGSAAQKGQKEVLREMVQKSLTGLQKNIAPQALELLFERVGFHPVAVIMEVEKLALYIDDRETITVDDLNLMVGRTREDALYELTDAFGKRQGARTLVLLHRLLEQGIHGLAILATMRNYIRKLLIFRSLQLGSEPFWKPGMNAGHFQKVYLPALKERGEWGELLKAHPYALFMSFSKAQEFSCIVLKRWLALLLRAEYRLKGAPLPQEAVLEELFLTLLKGKRQ